MSIEKTVFGTMPDGREVYEYFIENNNGVSVGVLTLGATLHNIVTPDKNGEYADILLGFDDVAGYLERSSYQGATVGPYANRIGNARFTINGKEYKLTANENDVTCLHGAGEFSSALWKPIIIDTDAIEFSHISPDGLNGFPGNVETTVTFRLGEKNDLHILYSAKTDADTFINLTNHAYFNLDGFDSGDILHQTMQIMASNYTPVDALSIPTGVIAPVEGTPFDFREPKEIGKDMEADDEQLRFTGGFDHNFCIDGWDGTLRKCAFAGDVASGRKLHVYTTMPGVQFYAGNFLKGEAGKEDKPMNRRTGFCLETQYYPDSPNKPDFPSCLVKAGDTVKSETVYIFETEIQKKDE